jgi:GDPmannose 4,6-dehydratase
MAEGHQVTGIVRRASATAPCRLLVGDLLDQASVDAALSAVRPHMVFNVAAVTSPGGGWGAPNPPLLAEVTGLGVVTLLEATLRHAPDATLVHASSSAVYDPPRYGLYGAAKRFAHDAVVGYRSRLRCSNAVLFSHTSPRQDCRFLARRICSTIARAAAGSGGRLKLTDVDSCRDWGHAPDYCEAMRAIALAEPGDYVVATGEPRPVRDMVEEALRLAGLDWDDVVDGERAPVPDELPPPPEGLAATRALGWAPTPTFAGLVRDNVGELAL